MFLGEFEHTIDGKGRLTVPAKFRDELASGVVVTRGLDGCLWAYSRSEWESLAEKISKLPTTNPNARNFARFMFSSAFDSIPDRQGRVVGGAVPRASDPVDDDVVVEGGGLIADEIDAVLSPDRGAAVEVVVPYHRIARSSGRTT